jgi:hypothetical protein
LSNDGKKGGLFGSIVDAAKHELFEDDSTKPAAAERSSAGAPAAPIATSAMPSTGSGLASSTVDPDALNIIKANVYVDVGGHKSRYLKFLKMLEALGKPQDALRALQVADETITAQGILEDITAHLSLLDAANKQAAAQFDAAAQERLGGADKEIAELQSANQNAAKEIERHQKETSVRNGKIMALQQARSDDEAKIAAAKQREAGAEAAVRTELLSMQQLFTSLR